MSYWEIMMLLCFGASWPVNLLKTYRLKSGRGKSLTFLVLVIIGYGCGIIHKLLYSPDKVLYLWCAILLLVVADLWLSLHYYRREPQPLAAAKSPSPPAANA
jgi:hypothetical protein